VFIAFESANISILFNETICFERTFTKLNYYNPKPNFKNLLLLYLPIFQILQLNKNLSTEISLI